MAAFETERDRLKKELEKLGATVVANDTAHRLIVNDKYEIGYTNFWYRFKGSHETIGLGRQKFLRLIASECGDE